MRGIYFDHIHPQLCPASSFIYSHLVFLSTSLHLLKSIIASHQCHHDAISISICLLCLVMGFVTAFSYIYIIYMYIMLLSWPSLLLSPLSSLTLPFLLSYFWSHPVSILLSNLHNLRPLNFNFGIAIIQVLLSQLNSWGLTGVSFVVISRRWQVMTAERGRSLSEGSASWVIYHPINVMSPRLIQKSNTNGLSSLYVYV